MISEYLISTCVKIWSWSKNPNVCKITYSVGHKNAATEFRCGGRFYFALFRSLSTNPKVQELLKSVHICESYRKNKSGAFFMARGV